MKELYFLAFVVTQSFVAFYVVIVVGKLRRKRVGSLATVSIGLAVPAATVAIGFLLSEAVYTSPGFGMILALVLLASAISVPFAVISALVGQRMTTWDRR